MSDETQSGVTDVPAATVQVYVGVKSAVVVSAGRGLCCDGLDPAFRIPQGVAAWDVIRFTIPDGVAGCYVPVVVQIGRFVSNLAAISIAPDGGKCAPAISTLPEDLTKQLADQKGVSVGALSFGRGTGTNATAAGVVRTTKGDTGSATFISYADVPASLFAADYFYSENVCQINGFPGPNGGPTLNGVEFPIVPLKAVNLDAGPNITVNGSTGTRTIPRITVGALVGYRGTDFGTATPGNYFDPGHYTVTGTGGKDVGAFTTSFDVPQTRFVLTNQPSVTEPLDRSQDLTITWTGGIPGTQVTIVGGSLVNGVSAAFLCAAPVAAGQLTIPSWVLLNLSPTATGPGTVPGQLTIGNRKVTTFKVSGLDIPSVAYAEAHTLYLSYK